MRQQLADSLFFKILILFGLIISVLSLLEPHISWISSFCGMFGSGCRDAIQYTFLNLPVSLWGVFFYITLLLASFLHRPSVFWLILAGTGVECGLINAMIIDRFVCFLCILNLIVILFLFVLTVKKTHIWQTIAVISCFILLTDIFLLKSNEGIATTPAQDSVLAVVDGMAIKESDIEKSIAGQLSKLERKIYQIKRSQLDKLIEKTILEKEAKKKNTTPAKLITNILSDVGTITNDEIDSHYQQHKSYYDKQNKTKSEIREIIRTYLQENRLSQQIKTIIQPLKSKYNVKDYLHPPRLPVTDIDIKNNYAHGPANAKVSIIVFSDYLCPSCKRAHEDIKTIKDAYKGKIRWIYKDFPLKRHKGAKWLAAAARSAGEQGKFWEFQDLLFSSKEKPDNKTLQQYARKLGLDVNLFFRRLTSNKYLSLIEKDIQDGSASGVSSTPTFIINGKVYSGNPGLKEFKEMIDRELK